MYNNNYGVWGHLGPSRGVGGAEGARKMFVYEYICIDIQY